MGLNQEGHLHPSVCSSCQPDLPSEPLRIAETLPVKNNDLEQEQDSAPDPPPTPTPYHVSTAVHSHFYSAQPYTAVATV